MLDSYRYRLSQITNKARNISDDAILNVLSKYNNYDSNKSIMLFCDPRGGSTWLAEMIMQILGSVVIWEPLQMGRTNDAFSDIGFGDRQYIPEHISWPQAKATFARLFAGKILDRETTLLSRSKIDYLNPSLAIFKFCRGNALLPWLCNQFAFEYPPVLLLRHPIAVVSSQMKLGAWGRKNGKVNNCQKERFGDQLNRQLMDSHLDFISQLKTLEEQLMFTWCIKNSIPLNSPHKQWCTVYYEDMVMDPVNSLNEVFKNWGLNPPEVPLDRYTNPSSSAEKEAIPTADQQLRSWQKSFDKYTLKKLLNIMEYFEIEVYDHGIYPKR